MTEDPELERLRERRAEAMRVEVPVTSASTPPSPPLDPALSGPKAQKGVVPVTMFCCPNCGLELYAITSVRTTGRMGRRVR